MSHDIFIKHYTSMSDDELARIAAQGDLNDEASAAMKVVLSDRNIDSSIMQFANEAQRIQEAE